MDQTAVAANGRRRLFGTFEGVFTPTLLTILGVIMYLRLGWVVGNAGLAGAWLIILLSVAITLATALSLSSIATNLRLGAGGAYSIISQSLGLEVGGAIGIPLFMSQALVVAMYVFGFREGWQWIFPDHPALVVDLVTFAVVFLIAHVSAALAFRLQFVIMAVIAASLISVVVAAAQGSMVQPTTWIGDGLDGQSFWVVFAVFFPAVTGILAGANMSGELRDPGRAIPVGTLGAVGVSTAVYLTLAWWLAHSATPAELVGDFTIMIDLAAWGPGVVAGLLGATASSAIVSIVGAPRILQAMAVHRVLPRADQLAVTAPNGEPRRAIWVSGAVAFASLMARDLNAIAPLVTMFFLLTYAMINVVVLIEQRLGQLSFRPTMRIPQAVPLLGTVGCLVAMFVIAPVFSMVAAATVVGVYTWLLHRRLVAPFGDSRSGLFAAVAEWSAKKVSVLPDSSERAWKPNLLVPVEDPGELRGTFRFITTLTHPRGSAKLLGLTTGGQGHELRKRLPVHVQNFQKAGVFASASVVSADDFGDGVSSAIQAFSSAFFRPNLLFAAVPSDSEREQAIHRIVQPALEHGLGIILFADHPKAGLGLESTVNLWVRPAVGEWWATIKQGHLDLSLLLAYVVHQNWGGDLNLITVVASDDEVEEQTRRLRELRRLARVQATPVVAVGPFDEAIAGHQADLNIFGLQPDIDFQACRELMRRGRASAMFLRGSGRENVLA